MFFVIAGTATAQGGLAALTEAGVKGPVVVVDLVKFKPGGEEEYNAYDKLAEAKLISLGGEVVFRGSAKAPPPLDSTEWDRVTFRKYPTPEAVLQMGGSKEYQAAFPHRFAAVEKSFVYAFSGELPSFGSATPGQDPMVVPAAPPSGDAVYMLNLLRFKDDAGKAMYYQQYGAKATQFIRALGGGPVIILKGIAPVIADEEIDRLILVMYPSAEAFRGMVTSSDYQAIMHLRTDAIELGLVWPFSNDLVYSKP